MRTALSKIETREWITIENGGQKIFGVLHRPAEIENPPVIFTLHGFASSKIGSNRSYVQLAEAFAENGFATLRFDFRGAGDSEKSLSEITFNDLVSDAVAVYTFLQTTEGVDATRIGLFGSSLGGSIAILSALLHKNIKALALWAPVASGMLWYRDFLRQYPEHAKTDPNQVLSSYRGMPLNPLFRQQFGEMNSAKALKELNHIPLLHMQGGKDQTLSLEHQEAFRLTASSTSRFLSFEEMDHRLGYEKRFPEVMQETVGWFKTHL